MFGFHGIIGLIYFIALFIFFFWFLSLPLLVLLGFLSVSRRTTDSILIYIRFVLGLILLLSFLGICFGGLISEKHANKSFLDMAPVILVILLALIVSNIAIRRKVEQNETLFKVRALAPVGFWLIVAVMFCVFVIF